MTPLLPRVLAAGAVCALGCGAPTDVAQSALSTRPESPSSPVVAGPKTLRLMSWNVEWLATPGQGMVPRTEIELGEMAQVIAQASPDVVVLQEVAQGNG